MIHDWGSGLGFHWAHQHPDRVLGVAYMKALVCPITWDPWPKEARKAFKGFRSPAGETLVLGKNIFVERVLPSSILRELTPDEMAEYRPPFRIAGMSVSPAFTWPRQIPIEGTPAEVDAIFKAYGQWLAEADVPKLFINAEPGSILVGKQREFFRAWPNQRDITVSGSHFIQEDSADEIGRAVADFVRGLKDVKTAGGRQRSGRPLAPLCCSWAGVIARS